MLPDVVRVNVLFGYSTEREQGCMWRFLIGGKLSRYGGHERINHKKLRKLQRFTWDFPHYRTPSPPMSEKMYAHITRFNFKIYSPGYLSLWIQYRVAQLIIVMLSPSLEPCFIFQQSSCQLHNFDYSFLFYLMWTYNW